MFLVSYLSVVAAGQNSGTASHSVAQRDQKDWSPVQCILYFVFLKNNESETGSS